MAANAPPDREALTGEEERITTSDILTDNSLLRLAHVGGNSKKDVVLCGDGSMVQLGLLSSQAAFCAWLYLIAPNAKVLVSVWQRRSTKLQPRASMARAQMAAQSHDCGGKGAAHNRAKRKARNSTCARTEFGDSNLDFPDHYPDYHFNLTTVANMENDKGELVDLYVALRTRAPVPNGRTPS